MMRWFTLRSLPDRQVSLALQLANLLAELVLACISPSAVNPVLTSERMNLGVFVEKFRLLAK